VPLAPTSLRRALAALPALALVAAAPALTAPANGAADRAPATTTTATAATTGSPSATTAARKAKDPRKTRGLYVDTRMPAHQQGPAYASIAKRAQALWLGAEYYPTDQVAGVVSTYVGLAERAGKTPMLVVYSIPDRDCGQYSSGGLPGVDAYKKWVTQVAKGIGSSKPMLVLEPDALPFYHEGTCGNANNRIKALRSAVRKLSKAGAWVYIDAGHSGWTTGDTSKDDTPWDGRAELLKKAGVAGARGFSTNVSNFRRMKDEKHYAEWMVRQLRKLGVKGVKYVVDTSRNGAKKPVDGDVINPTWARVGQKPKLRFDKAFDGTLWVKHPGESDGTVNGGPASGQWCDLLADRLLGDEKSQNGC